MNSKQSKHLYEFGPFHLYPDEGLLLRNGDSVRLTPKAFETLLLLVTNQGRVLDKHELMEKIWPDTFVEEVNLAKNISSLRRILAEGDSKGLYIETLPKRGYRFVAPVEEYRGTVSESADAQTNAGLMSSATKTERQPVDTLELPSDDGAKTDVRDRIAPSTSGVSSRSTRRVLITSGASSRSARRVLILAAALSAALLLAVATIWVLSRPPIPNTSSQRIIPITTFPGSEVHPAISPDGKQIAFAWRGKNNDNWDIYVKLVGNGEPLRLTADAVIERNPVWSPDGGQIAYLRESEDGIGVSVYVVPSLGGGARRLTETQGLSFAWSPDGESLALAERDMKDAPLRLSLFTIKTGERRRLTNPPVNSFGDMNPTFSPDGRTLAFARAQPSSANAWDIHLISVTGEDEKRLTFDETLIGGLDWTEDGRAIVFSSSRGGGLPSLWRIPTSGGSTEPLPGVGGTASSPSISRQGNRLAYVNATVDSNIWRVDLTRSHKATSPIRLISSTIYDHSPEYSPDGKRIAFISGRSGNSEVWLCNSDGSSATQLTSLKGTATGNPRWSPNGQDIVFDSNVEGNAEIFRVNVQGGNPQRLTNDGAEDIAPRWSRQGTWIYFTSNRTGEFQIWRISSVRSDTAQVTRHGGFDAAESPDGKYLYYAKGRNTSGLWRVPSAGGEEILVVDTLKAGYLRYWVAVDEGLYFATRATPLPTVQFFSFDSGQLSEVYKLEKSLLVGAPGLSISPDGRSLLLAQMDDSESDVTVIDSFH